jgi:teichoic acid transport system permease protein
VTTTTTRTTPSTTDRVGTTEDAAALARRYGLQRAGARPSLTAYTKQLWDRRHFITEYSAARNEVGYSRSFLGQAWQVLTPLLNVGVYYLVFGVLLHTKRGVHNFIAFLTIGLFVFTFAQSSAATGTKAITGNLGLVRALQFPRAALSISTTMVALRRLLYSLIVMIPIVIITGEPITWKWLELIPTLVLATPFCLGLGFLFARLGAHVPDTSQVLPFVLRIWMYLSGILFSIAQVSKTHAPWVKTVLENNPGAIYPALARHALLTDTPLPANYWWLGAVWSVGLLLVGYLVFWKGEEGYGRV